MEETEDRIADEGRVRAAIQRLEGLVPHLVQNRAGLTPDLTDRARSLALDILRAAPADDVVETPAGTWDRQEVYSAVGETVLAQQVFDSGLLWLANRSLHVFGYALGVSVDDERRVNGLMLYQTYDEEGVLFGEDLEVRGRRKFRFWFGSLWGG